MARVSGGKPGPELGTVHSGPFLEDHVCLNVKIPVTVADRISGIARSKGVTRSAVVRAILKTYLLKGSGSDAKEGKHELHQQGQDKAVASPSHA